MKRVLLSCLLGVSTICMMAQGSSNEDWRTQKYYPIDYKKYANVQQGPSTAPAQLPLHKSQEPVAGSAEGGLSIVDLGTSGNIYTIIDPHTNPLAIDADLNAVTFIHRTTQQIYPGDDPNNGQYRYDYSHDGGMTWSLENGLLNPGGTQNGFASRYPMVSIFNPSGNTDPDSAYIAYFGTYHDGANGNWNGYWVGSARLDGAPSTFTSTAWTANNEDVQIAHGLVQSTPGTFWAVDEDFDNTNTNGIVISKGTWNSTTKDVDWTVDQVLAPTFDVSFDGSPQITGVNISFDPTGMYGWISGTGDLTPGDENVLDPFFYQSTDGGNSWTGPMVINLDDVAGILDFYNLDNGPVSTSFDCALGVDINGNPHFVTTILPGSDYAVLGGAPGKRIVDITYDPTSPVGCEWKAYVMDSVETFRGDAITTGTDPVSIDNHTKVSTSLDGSKLFFSWVDSDALSTGGGNDLPDMFMAAIDVTNGTRTATRNITSGDPTFNQAALFPTTSVRAFDDGAGNYTVPTVLTRTNNIADATDTIYFHYVTNNNWSDVDFNMPIDDTPPSLTVLGDDPLWVALGGTFTDPGATADDCFDGDLTASIVVTGTVDVNTQGTYTVTYTVTDAAGNMTEETRTVIVSAAPVAAFTIQDNFGCAISLIDNSTNFPQSWQWMFGDGGGSGNQNPTHTYGANNSYTITLTVTNPIGSDQTSDTYDCNSIGINDPSFAATVDVYPNPAENMVQISFASLPTEDVQVSFYSAIGQSLIQTSSIAASSTIELDLSDFAKGLYLVKIESEGQTAIKKLTVK